MLDLDPGLPRVSDRLIPDLWNQGLLPGRSHQIRVQVHLVFILVEENDNRGINAGSWIMGLGTVPRLVDAFAVFHNMRSILGFADGHAEVRRWHDQSLIEWCHRAMERQGFAFGMTPPADEQEDVEYMAQGFPYKSLK